MARIVPEYLEATVKKYPDKKAFIDENRALTFSELYQETLHIASALINEGFFKKPIAVYLNKSVECVPAYEGVTFSGNFYSPIDTEMPDERIEKIINKLSPVAVITDEAHKEKAKSFAGNAKVLCYEELQKVQIESEKIDCVKNQIIDSDVLYVLFTSGSTGTPKGAIISHLGMVDLTEWIAKALSITDETVFGNQTPFYFSFSVYEIYQTLKNGCTTYIIPHKLFSFPTKLMKYVEERDINTVIWVPSVLTYISVLKAINKPHLTKVKNIFFGAEAMPSVHLNRWMKEYPDVRFVNLYGPTEVTDTCTFYTIDKPIADNEMLPIGKTCINKDTFLLSDEDKLVTAPDEIGEICVRGSGLAYGYYNDPEKTAEAFVQNPLNNAYHEIIYRTGDLGKFNDNGDMVYIGRKDFQIKHKGHRIELGEIEAAVATIDGIDDQCCIYDNDKLRIVLFYTGKATAAQIGENLKDMLPEYMIPTKRVQLKAMPHNLNGKTDRQKLKEKIKEIDAE